MGSGSGRGGYGHALGPSLADPHPQVYDQIEDEHQLKIFANHCYVVSLAREGAGDDKVIRVRLELKGLS